MTRGQESLVMELEAPAAEQVAFARANRAALFVVRATEDELAEHERVLDEIDKESKGKCLWAEADSAA